ncbi:MAG: hypothetical protein JEZ09_01610 [Salinivirgaceae bacterium]|nr:hypothetical protein [Salinivirgaceae bacterium]
MIQIIWEYKVKPDQASNFEDIYGKNGEWVTFFKKSKAYKKTELVIKDLENNMYMTIDTWKSLDLYEQFFKQNLKEFKRLNNKFKNLLLEENQVGIFSED